MHDFDINAAMADISSTTDLLERALKLSGLVTTMFQRHGIHLSWLAEVRSSSTPRVGTCQAT